MNRTAAYLLSALLLMLCSPAAAQDPDSAYLARVQDTVDRYYRLHPRKRLSGEERRFRVIPLYGIMYAPETGPLAMGGFMGSYRTSRDTLVPLSSVGAVAMVSTNLSVAGAVTGDWYGPAGGFRIRYLVRFNNSPRYFWGLGFDSAMDDASRSTLTSRRVRARAEFLYRRGGLLQAGGFLGYDFYRAADFSDPQAVAGLPLTTGYMTMGAYFDLDTRDSRTAPSRGVYLMLEPGINIPLAGTAFFFSTEFTADFYFPLWKGCVGAVDIYGNLLTGGAPWTMWPEAGGDVRLRGYYQGRYRDRNLLSFQLELRQTVYRSHGLAAWIGAGNVFPSFGDLDIKNTLPTYGAGYRLSFLGLVLRLDAGFGLRGQWAVTAGLSHSF